jgi:hypothetical protein
MQGASLTKCGPGIASQNSDCQPEGRGEEEESIHCPFGICDVDDGPPMRSTSLMDHILRPLEDPVVYP